MNAREKAGRLIEQTLSRVHELQEQVDDLNRLRQVLAAEEDRCSAQSHEFTAAHASLLCVQTIIERLHDRSVELGHYAAKLAQTHGIDIGSMKII